MPVEKITPKSKADWHTLRGMDVTASAVGALFGEHEFLTMFALWALKTGRVDRDEEENPAIQRGRLLEQVAVQLLRETYPRWKITHNAKANVYFRDPDVRLGATPDVLVVDKQRGPGVVQIKSVEASVFRRKWIVDGEVEPPLWIALQASVEAHLTGSRWAAVAPLVVGHGLEMPLIDVPIVPGLIDSIERKVTEFWRMVEEGIEPPADYRRDGPTLDALYPGDDEEEVDLSADNRIPTLIKEREFYRDAMTTAERQIAAIDAEVKAKMGNATVAHLGDGRRITRRLVKKAGHFVQPVSYRQLRFPSDKE